MKVEPVIQARTHLAVIYFCSIITIGLIVTLLLYTGILDASWEASIDLVKETARFFSQ